MNKPTMYIVFGMGLLIIVLFLYIIFSKPVVKIIPFDDKPYRDSINYYRNANNKLHTVNDSLARSNDSLDNIEQTIITRYNAKIIYLNGATTAELDEYISSNLN